MTKSEKPIPPNSDARNLMDPIPDEQSSQNEESPVVRGYASETYAAKALEERAEGAD